MNRIEQLQRERRAKHIAAWLQSVKVFAIELAPVVLFAGIVACLTVMIRTMSRGL